MTLLRKGRWKNSSDRLFRGHDPCLNASGTAVRRTLRKIPDKLGTDDLRSYQAYLLKERKLAVGSAVARVAALRFLFVPSNATALIASIMTARRIPSVG